MKLQRGICVQSWALVHLVQMVHHTEGGCFVLEGCLRGIDHAAQVVVLHNNSGCRAAARMQPM